MLRFVLILIPIAVTLYGLFDAINAPRDDVRTMSKGVWIFLIIVLFFVGAVMWFFLGRPRRSAGPSGGGGSGYAPPQGPDDDPEFLSQLDWERRRKPHADS